MLICYLLDAALYAVHQEVTEMAEAHDGTGGGMDLFLEWAGRTGEMNPSTANAFRSTAGKVLSVEEQEIDEIDVTMLDVERLIARWENLNRTNYSSGSVQTYKSRFRQAVAMYKAWLVKDTDWKNAGKANASSGKQAAVKTGRPRTKAKEPSVTATTEPGTEPAVAGVRLVGYDLPLRPDLMVRLTLPVDLTSADAQRISTFVSSLAFDSSDGPNAARGGGGESPGGG